MSNLCKFCSFCEGQMTADAFANPATAFLLGFLDLKITQNLVHSSHFDLMWYIWLQERLQDHNSLLKFGDKFQSEIRLFWLIWTSGRNGARQKVERGKNGICGGWLLGRLVGWVGRRVSGWLLVGRWVGMFSSASLQCSQFSPDLPQFGIPLSENWKTSDKYENKKIEVWECMTLGASYKSVLRTKDKSLPVIPLQV